MHSKLTSRTALVPLILLKDRQNESFLEFTDRFRVKNVALVHLQYECLKLIFHGSPRLFSMFC